MTHSDPQLASGIAAGAVEHQRQLGAAVQAEPAAARRAPAAAAPPVPAPAPTPAPAAVVVEQQAAPAPSVAPAAEPQGLRVSQVRFRDAEEFIRVARALSKDTLFMSSKVCEILDLKRGAVHNRMTRWQNYGWIEAVTTPHDHYALRVEVDQDTIPADLV